MRQERAVQGRKVVGSLGCMMKGRTVSMEVKKGLNDGIIVLTITYEVKLGCGMKDKGQGSKQLK